MKEFKFIISGGGTGGHIYPAISISNELKLRYPNSKILFVGARDRMEMQIVPKYGFKIIGLWISGFNRNFSIKNLIIPIKLLFSLITKLRVLRCPASEGMSVLYVAAHTQTSPIASQSHSPPNETE